MVLNLSWVYAFFGYGDIALSKIIILLLLILTLYQAYAIKQYTKNKWSGVCAFSMLFYAAWLTVATGLNFDIKLM